MISNTVRIVSLSSTAVVANLALKGIYGSASAFLSTNFLLDGEIACLYSPGC